MPVLTSCQARSPPAVESPPRKKFKFSLKLKAKKKRKAKNPMDSDSENESGKENGDSTMNFESKRPLNSPLTKSTNGLTEANTTFGLQSETVNPPLPYTGLANLGNTCYLNAVLQVLRYCPEFLKSLVNLDEMSGQNCTMTAINLASESDHPLDEDSLPSSRPSIIHSIHKLTSAMQNAEENYGRFGLEANEVKSRSGWTTLAVRPQDFVKDFSGLCPPFSGYQQHDAQEFLRSFLSLVEEECIGLVKGEQQEDVKGGISVANNNDSKVRGGCKYPSTIASSVAMETKGEPTKTMVTGESTRIQPNSDIDWNDTELSSNLYTTISKSVTNCKTTSPDDVNIVRRLFEGTLLLQTCCLNCEGIRQRHENFQDISVPVQNAKPDTSEERGNNLSDSEDESDQALNLSWAISKFASIERLNGENKYFCDNCATLTEADISTYFEKLPQVLTIHLKRFQTSYGTQNLYSSSWVTKVTKSLHTPQQLALKKWCSKTCSAKNAVYSLFGVVMHNGMSSCSGHYLSYVNVDILKKKADGGRKMNDGECSGKVHCEALGRGDETMKVDDSCMTAIDQCYNTEVPSKDGGQNHVKCGSCQSSATKTNGVSSDTKANGLMSHCKKNVTKGKSHACKARDSESNSSHSVCDEEIKCETQSKAKDGHVPSQTKSVNEESRDLCCEENLAMDLDDEDTCDYSELVKDAIKPTSPITIQDNIKDAPDTDTRIKSDTQINRETSRHSRTDSMKDDHGSDSSSDEDEALFPTFTHIPRSMDITRFFKPIPKSERSKKKSRRNFEMSSDQSCTSESSPASSNIRSNRDSPDQENQNDSQTTDAANSSQKLTATSLQVSHGSAFSTPEKNPVSANMRSDGESLNQESKGTDSCSQTTNIANDVQNGLQKSPGHFVSSGVAMNGHSIGQEIGGQDLPSCTQKTDGVEHRNGKTRNTDYSSESGTSTKLMHDTEPSDEVFTNDCKPSTDDCVKAGLEEQHSQDEPHADDNTDIDSLKAKCSYSNLSANRMESHENNTHNINHVEPSSTNGFTPASDGKSFKCKDACDSSNIDGLKQPIFSSTWLKFDDAEVQEISAKDMEEILSPSSSCYSTPYLLFYYRC